MYNGLGLKTPRGSGTNGYVQRNLSFAKPRNNTPYKYDAESVKPARKPSADILLHRSKRQIEVECLLLQEELKEAGGHSEEEIAALVAKLRENKLAQLEERLKRNSTEALRVEKETEMERLKTAFGIRSDAKEGDAFKFETEQERQEKMARYAEDDRVERERKDRERASRYALRR